MTKMKYCLTYYFSRVTVCFENPVVYVINVHQRSKYFGSTSAKLLSPCTPVIQQMRPLQMMRMWTQQVLCRETRRVLEVSLAVGFQRKDFKTSCFRWERKSLRNWYLLGNMKSQKKKLQLLKCTYTAGWRCCDSQQYQRQSIIFTNASCANEHSQKSADFSGREKRSVSLLAELIQGTKVKAPPSRPLLLLLLWGLLMCAEEPGLCLGLFISSSLPAINIHIHMKSAVSHQQLSRRTLRRTGKKDLFLLKMLTILFSPFLAMIYLTF